MKTKYIKYLGLSGLLSPLAGALSISTSIFLHDWFSWTEYALSDLGAVDTANSMVFNSGMILSGTLGLLFSIALFKISRGKPDKAGSAFFSAGVISLILVGVFPSGKDPHLFVSLAFFGLSAIGMTLVGLDETLKRESIGYFTLIVVGIGLPIAYLTSKTYSGVAIPEMVGVVCFSAFTVTHGIKIIRRPEKATFEDG